jgi:hypothetical protein
VADINVQKKSGPGMWPWIIGALVLVLVVWGIAEMTRDDHDTATAADPVMTEPAAERAPAQPAPGTPDPDATGAAPEGTVGPGTPAPGTAPTEPGATGAGTGTPPPDPTTTP